MCTLHGAFRVISNSPRRHAGMQRELAHENGQIGVGHDLRFRVSDDLRHFRFALDADDVVAMFDGFDDDGSVVELASDDAVAVLLAGVVVDDVDGVVADVALLVDELGVVFLVRHHRRHVEADLQNLVLGNGTIKGKTYIRHVMFELK